MEKQKMSYEEWLSEAGLAEYQTSFNKTQAHNFKIAWEFGHNPVEFMEKVRNVWEDWKDIGSDKNIRRYYNVIAKSLFKKAGILSYTRTLEAVHLLCMELLKTETDEFIWSSVGEFEEASLGDLLAGTYWFLSDWHGGQDSLEYRTMCSVGMIYHPGCGADGPEENSSEATAYELWELKCPFLLV